MSESTATTELVQDLLARYRTGNESVLPSLLEVAHARIRTLAQIQLRKFPLLRSLGEQTDSMLHDAVLRLEQAMKATKPESARQFFAMASTHIRWALLDLKRRADKERIPDTQRCAEPAYPGSGPTSRVQKRDQVEMIHARVEELPDPLREVVDLLFYQGLTQKEVAGIIGVSERTVKRRWREARLALGEALKLFE